MTAKQLEMAHALYDGAWRWAVDAESSMIYKYSYIRRTSELLIRFWDSTSLYVYSGVSKKKIQDFVDAPSRGHYFIEFIKDRHQFRRLDNFFRRIPARHFDQDQGRTAA